MQQLYEKQSTPSNSSGVVTTQPKSKDLTRAVTTTSGGLHTELEESSLNEVTPALRTETEATPQTAAGHPYRRMVLLRSGERGSELGVLEKTTYDRSLRQRVPTVVIEKGLVAKDKVFDRQRTIVQMTPLQTHQAQRTENAMKQRKVVLDAKYQQLEQWQMKQIDDCLRRLKTEQFTVADRLRYLKESIAEVREKRREEGSSFTLNIPDYTEKVQLIMRQVQLEVAGRPDGGTREIIKKMYLLEDKARRDARAEGPFESARDN